MKPLKIYYVDYLIVNNYKEYLIEVIMSLEIRSVKINITNYILGLTRDRHTRKILRITLEEEITSSGNYGHSKIYPLPTKLQSLINEFCENPASGAIDNLKTYFNKSIKAGYTSGGRRAFSKPKLYEKKKILPSSSDIAAVGEGIVAYYFENIKNYTFEIRPFGVSPDLIFRDRLKKPASTHLIEVKASLSEKNPRMTIAIDILSILAKTTFLRKGKYISHVCRVYIKQIDNLVIKDLIMERV